MSDEAGWKRVAEAVTSRLVELGMSWTALYDSGAISEPTMRAMRRGQPLQRPYKRAALTRALGWTPDSIDRLLAGKPAQLVEPVAAGPSYEQVAQLPERVSAIEAELAELRARVALLEGPGGEVRSLRAAADAGGARPAKTVGRRVNRPTGVPSDDGPAIDE